MARGANPLFGPKTSVPIRSKLTAKEQQAFDVQERMFAWYDENVSYQSRKHHEASGGFVVDTLDYKGDREIKFTKNCGYHRDDGPSRIEHDSRTSTVRTSWYQDGIKHRSGAPAEEKLDLKTGQLVSEGWWHKGLPHREEGPCKIVAGKGIRWGYHGRTFHNEPAFLAYKKKYNQEVLQEENYDGSPA